MMYIENYVFFFPVPLHIDDIKFYSERIEIPPLPSLFVNKMSCKETDFKHFRRDFSATTIENNDIEELLFQIDKEELRHMQCYNSGGNEIASTDQLSDHIVQVIINPRDIILH